MLDPQYYPASPTDPDTVAGWVGHLEMVGRPARPMLVEQLYPVPAGAACPWTPAPFVGHRVPGTPRVV
jgi:hypothetical protein